MANIAIRPRIISAINGNRMKRLKKRFVLTVGSFTGFCGVEGFEVMLANFQF